MEKKKAIMVNEDLHAIVKARASAQKMTLEQFVQHLINLHKTLLGDDLR